MTILNADAANLPKIGVGHFAFDPKPSVAILLPMLNNTGAQIVRIEVPWSDTETALGQYAVPSYPGWFISEMRAAGRQVVIVCDYGNALYPGSSAFNLPPRDAASRTAYTNPWISANETTRALYVARMIGCAILAGVSLLTLFCLRDTGADPNNDQFNFGMHKFDGTPKLAAAACKMMVDTLAGALTYDAEAIPVTGGNNYRITLRKAGVVTKIIWSDAPITSIVEPMATVQNVIDSNGGRPWFRFQPAGIMITVGPAIAPIIITGTC